MPLRTVRLPASPLRFVVQCPYCGEVPVVIPVEDDDWHAAAAFGYLAAKGHERSCPKERRPPSPWGSAAARR